MEDSLIKIESECLSPRGYNKKNVMFVVNCCERKYSTGT